MTRGSPPAAVRPHRVRRGTFVVRASAPADALAARTRLREAWDDALLPALARAFDAANARDDVVRIARLEVHVRLATPDDVNDVLPALLTARVAEELAARLGGQLDAARTSSPPHAERELAPAEPSTAADDGWTTLLHYVSTGSLPWASAGRPADEVARELAIVARDGIQRLAAMFATRRASEAEWFRVLQLVGLDYAADLVRSLPAVASRHWRHALLIVLARLTVPAIHGTIAASGIDERLRIATTLLVQACAASVHDTPDVIAATVARATGPLGQNVVREVSAALAEPGADAGIPVREAPIVSPAPEIGAPLNGARAAPPEMHAPAPDRRPPGSSRTRLAGEPREMPATRVATSADDARGDGDDGFALAVPLAGLLVLHPFIGPLFAHTGVRDGSVIPAHALPRAAALLHHLATGRYDVHEFELALVKVLLGLTPTTPLPVAEGTLHAADIAQCDDLLDAAVKHWRVLRNTSRDGLRGSFLVRPGLLRRDAHGWTLRVAPGAFDVLLDHLPWSLGIVRLPWMPEAIVTQWTR